MAICALWDLPAVARPLWGEIVVFRYVEGHVMLGQVGQVITHFNLCGVITQHTQENGTERRIPSISTLVTFSDQELHCQLAKSWYQEKATFRVYASRGIIGSDEHGPISEILYGEMIQTFAVCQIGFAL